jgi:hypothetical protein
MIHPKGSPSSRIWVILETPFSTDKEKGYLMSGGAGFVFDKMMSDGGIKDYYVTCRRPVLEHPDSVQIIENDINHYKPPFIIAVDTVGWHLCKELKPSSQHKTHKTQLGKYVGSLLIAEKNLLSYPHYIMPIYDIQKYLGDWSERNITAFFDFQKLRIEYEYWRTHGVINPLPERDLRFKEYDLDSLLHELDICNNSNYLSVDIETCYPKADSEFRGHPGYPITIGLATSSIFGLSFNLFRSSHNESIILWKRLNQLLSTHSIIGQNFYNFDLHFLSSLGFSIDKSKIEDTLIRHHILWPELSHKLQFMTRQYTREPYYKDEGHNWNMKDMSRLRRYNALDVTVTYEVFEQQELEFQERKELAS